MSVGKRAAEILRTADRKVLAELTAVLVALWLASGPQRPLYVVAVAFWVVLGLARYLSGMISRWRGKDGTIPAGTDELRQFELYLVCAVFLILSYSGTGRNFLYPLPYLVLAAIGGFDPAWRNRLESLAAAVAMEVAMAWSRPAFPWFEVGFHVAAFCGFLFLLGAMEWQWVAAQKARYRAEFERRLRQRQEEAAEYRLIGITASHVDAPQEKRSRDLVLSSTKEIGLSMANVLDVLRAAMNPHVIAVYWLSTDESRLQLKDARPEARKKLLQKSLDARSGLLGAVVSKRATVRQKYFRPSSRDASYYQKPTAIRYFVGVPLLESVQGGPANIRGVLFADREADVPFNHMDEESLEVAARELLRIVQTEKKLAELDGMRNQYRELYNITSRVLELSGFQEVAHHLVESLRKFIDGAELAALLTREGKRHMVLTACDAGEKFRQWCAKHVGSTFPSSGSLCALAMRENETMHSDDFYKRDRRTRVLFGQGLDPPGVASVMVTAIPHDPDRPGEAMGALVVASSRQGFFSSRVAALIRQKQQLETFANVARLVLVNAMQYEKLERMATTDALTGLLNRRRFFEILEEESAKALRYRRPLGLIMCDVDHFKSINDTYGHPMGDEVLKRVARVLGQEARATDRVCRIGGEEFAVVLPETDYQGAVHLAERFRQEIAAQRFTHEGKEFSVTLSLGICVLPEHATHIEQLVQRADLALYQAKHGGRNRVVVYRPEFLQAAAGEKA